MDSTCALADFGGKHVWASNISCGKIRDDYIIPSIQRRRHRGQYAGAQVLEVFAVKYHDINDKVVLPFPLD